MTRIVDNNGIGALFATFEIHQNGGEYQLDESHIGDAVALADNNTINHGSNGAKLLGRLEHVCAGLATVQISGVVRLKLKAGATAPNVGESVVLDGEGSVYQAPAIDGAFGDPAGGNVARGLTLAVDGTSTCDVLI